MFHASPVVLPQQLRLDVLTEFARARSAEEVEVAEQILDLIENPDALDLAEFFAPLPEKDPKGFTPKTYNDLLDEAYDEAVRLRQHGGTYTNDLEQQQSNPSKYAFTMIKEGRGQLHKALYSDRSKGVDLGTIISQVPVMANPDIVMWANLGTMFSSNWSIVMAGYGLFKAIESGDLGNIIFALGFLVSAVLGVFFPVAGFLLSLALSIAQIIYGLITGQLEWPWDRLEKIINECRKNRDESWQASLRKTLRENIAPELDSMWQRYQQSMARSVAQAEVVIDIAASFASTDGAGNLAHEARTARGALRDTFRDTLYASDFKSRMVETTYAALKGFASGDPTPIDGDTVYLHCGYRPTRVLDGGPDRVVEWRMNEAGHQKWRLERFGSTWRLLCLRADQRYLGAWSRNDVAVAELRAGTENYANVMMNLESLGGGRYLIRNPKPHDNRILHGLNERSPEHGDKLVFQATAHDGKESREWYLQRVNHVSGFFTFTQKFVWKNRAEIVKAVRYAATGGSGGPDEGNGPYSREVVESPLLQDTWKATPWVPQTTEIYDTLSSSGYFLPMYVPVVVSLREKVRKNKQFLVVNRRSGLAMDLREMTSDPTPLVLRRPETTVTGVWAVTQAPQDSEGTVIQNTWSRACLERGDADEPDGDPVQGACDTGTAHLWSIPRSEYPGWYYIESSDSTVVSTGDKGTGLGTELSMAPRRTGDRGQLWSFQDPAGYRTKRPQGVPKLSFVVKNASPNYFKGDIELSNPVGGLAIPHWSLMLVLPDPITVDGIAEGADRVELRTSHRQSDGTTVAVIWGAPAAALPGGGSVRFAVHGDSHGTRSFRPLWSFLNGQVILS